MAETGLVKKLGIKPGQRLLVLNAPGDYVEQLEPLPEGVRVATEPDGTFELVQVFVHNRADVERLAPAAARSLMPGGVLWFSYPKKSSKVKTDVTRDTGWETVKAGGLEPVTQIAIDDTWSALRFRPLSEIKSRRPA